MSIQDLCNFTVHTPDGRPANVIYEDVSEMIHTLQPNTDDGDSHTKQHMQHNVYTETQHTARARRSGCTFHTHTHKHCASVFLLLVKYAFFTLSSCYAVGTPHTHSNIHSSLGCARSDETCEIIIESLVALVPHRRRRCVAARESGVPVQRRRRSQF